MLLLLFSIAEEPSPTIFHFYEGQSVDSCQSNHFVVHNRRNFKADGAPALIELKVLISTQGSHVSDPLTGSDIKLHLLWTDLIEAPQEAARHVR